MSTYHLTGVISALLSILASAGLATQVRLLWQRLRQSHGEERVSEGLSINRFVTSFIVFLALFTYGGLLNPFNHYLAWPRLLGIALALLILLQIYWDRRCRVSGFAFLACFAAFLLSVMIMVSCRPLENLNPLIMPAMMVVVSLIYLQGGMAQIFMIRSSGKTGGLSQGMHLLFVLKDVSLATFAIAMGVSHGGPILFTCAVGLFVNISTLWCFRWTRRNSLNRLKEAEVDCGAPSV
ncbi:hypothetical protein [Coraliomargarita parva]|uniref:hypothetical protein n=1 Tax=Coraliomargarita parva TaxID=3014050 RepID=UPI0022B4B7A8|nr:hypothetical protein [Coraliomargarita parva]